MGLFAIGIRRVAVLLCLWAVCSAVWSQSVPRTLVSGLVQALNTQDEKKIRAYIEQNVVPTVALDKRTARWQELARQGAPFKIVRDLKETADMVCVIVLDRNGARIAMTVRFESRARVMLLGLQLAPAFTAEGAGPESSQWVDLSGLAKSICEKSKSPGMGIAMYRNGELSTAVTGVRRVKGNDAVQADDVWSIGSIGRPLCTTVIAVLIEQGKLRWDETLKQVFPDLPMDPGYQKVTLEQVMRHRGGVPADLAFQAADVKRIVSGAKTAVAMRDRYVRDILGRQPVAKPDTQFVYSNAGYVLLSHAAEKVTGKPYEQLLRTLVFQPLGLLHSYTGADALPKGRPSGHVEAADGLSPRDAGGVLEYLFAGVGGGIFMSVGDLAKFGEAHLLGLEGQNGLLKAATIARLHKGVAESPRGGRLYACGWGIESLPGIEALHGHNGSNGTMRAELAIFPQSKLVVAAVVNRGGQTEPAPGMEAVLAIAGRYAIKQ